MAVAIPRVITSTSASGAQVIDGSLKFDGGYLTRTPGSAGNRRTWTYSGWVKFDENKDQAEPLFVAGNSSSDFTQIYTYKSLESDIALAAKTSSADKVEITSNNLLRDTGWYHIVVIFNSNVAAYQTDTTIYANGVEISRNTNTYAGGQGYESWVNSTSEPHYIGHLWNGNDFKGHMSQVYLIDGMNLGPGYFGFTDPLTDTWRPKRLKGITVNDGTTWSDFVTTTSGGYTSGYEATKAFNADITDWSAPASGGVDKWLGVTSANPFGIKCELVEMKFWATKLEINGEVVYTNAAGGDTVQSYYLTDFDTFKIYGKAD